MYYDGAWRTRRGFALGFADAKGEPIPYTGKNGFHRGKLRERGRSGMMASHLWSVKPGNRCCPGHDHVWHDRGTARRRSDAQWQRDWADEMDE